MSPDQTTIDTRLKRALMLAAVGIAIPLLAFFVGSQSGGGDLSVANAASSGQSSQQGGHGGPGGPHNPFDNEEFVDELAQALGVDVDTLQNALDDTMPAPLTRKEMRAKRAAELQKLADAIGVSVTDLKAALKEIAPNGRPGRGGHGKGGPGGGNAANHTAMERRMARKLAKALDVDVAKVRAALKQAREDREAEMEARHEKFIADLAAALNLDADKVEDALDEVRPAPGRHGEDR